MGTFLKDIRSFHDFQNIYTKKYMDIKWYSFPHRLDVMISNVNYFGQLWVIFNHALKRHKTVMCVCPVNAMFSL